MSTGPFHYRTAEQLLGQVTRKSATGCPIVAEGSDVADILAAAQAHATLALAAATALGVGSDDPPPRDAEEWYRAAGTPLRQEVAPDA